MYKDFNILFGLCINVNKKKVGRNTIKKLGLISILMHDNIISCIVKSELFSFSRNLMEYSNVRILNGKIGIEVEL